MNVFIIGVTGRIGDLVAQKLRSRGATVLGLVCRTDQYGQLAKRGIHTTVRDLASITAHELALMSDDVDAIVFTAGSNGGSKEVTRTIDREGLPQQPGQLYSPASTGSLWCQ